MSHRYIIKQKTFSRLFEIVEAKSGIVDYSGEWKKTKLVLKNHEGEPLLEVNKINPKGIHFSWRVKYEIALIAIPETFILECKKPFKFLWNTKFLNNIYEMNSPIPKEVEIKQNGKSIFKEKYRSEFYISNSLSRNEKTFTIAMYLCILNQHQPAEIMD